jgi:glycosyltransferase involved in cell wall biosynthesis
LFVMPNRLVEGDAEGFGLVAIEAAHAGLPVVGTAVEGLRASVVENVTGRLVAPGDPAALSGAIVDLLSDAVERARLGASARIEAARRFTWAAVGDRYAAALWRLAEHHRAPPG